MDEKTVVIHMHAQSDDLCSLIESWVTLTKEQWEGMDAAERERYVQTKLDEMNEWRKRENE
jgi:hypothetical protein